MAESLKDLNTMLIDPNRDFSNHVKCSCRYHLCWLSLGTIYLKFLSIGYIGQVI